jgi:hypothetical protein
MQQKYVPLAEGNKHNRRSLADAIELLNAHAGFHTNDRATIRTSQLLLAAKEPIFQLCVIFQGPGSDVTFLVSLPASSHCTTVASETNALETIGTFNLDDASVDYYGNVVLTNGTQLKAVGVIPTPLPYELSELDGHILRHTIGFLGIGDRVFRTLGEELDSETRTTLPAIRAIDFQRLQGRKMPLLKQLRNSMADSGEFPNIPSLQKLSTTLSKCGMRDQLRRQKSR